MPPDEWDPLTILGRAIRLLNPRRVAMAFGYCPTCSRTLLVRLQLTPIGVRCIRCHGSAIHMSIGTVLTDLLKERHRPSVYELSARGPLIQFLRGQGVDLTCSEYFDDLPPGQWRGGVQCQDVQQLTYPDQSFDVCTSTEVFEHVPEDQKGFREIHRVLKPGGSFVFTVPLSEQLHTVERAKLEKGKLKHVLSPVYHGDRQRGWRSVLCFRDYGRDIMQRLLGANFTSAEIVEPIANRWWGLGVPVIVARKSATR